tara:strand:- start:983 stop:1453 length:471 start_codon:yes stop_codon:yes gene_type:complete
MPRQETYGKTEEIIGNWFQHSGKRKNIVLATKIASKSTGLEWIRAGKEKLGFDKKNINAAVDASLKRLQTDYIDLYQLHWPERKVPLFGKLDFSYDEKDINWTSFNEVLENLNDLVKDRQNTPYRTFKRNTLGYDEILRNLKTEKPTSYDVYSKCL